MKIITLIENVAYQRDLFAEHGLSFYIDNGTKKILFDTGQTGHFIHNAKILNIDLEAVDYVVISHGHFDHTGGLYDFLKINKRAEVIVKKEAFNPKYKGKNRFIGVDYEPAIIDKRVTYIEKPRKIDDDIYVMPEITIHNPDDTSFQPFMVKSADGFIEDTFNDELYLGIVKNNKLSVISSCSHRGITNILNTAVDYFELPVNMVLGGFHTRASCNERMNLIKTCFQNHGVRSLGICHCTGIDKYAELKSWFEKEAFYNYTGNEINLI